MLFFFFFSSTMLECGHCCLSLFWIRCFEASAVAQVVKWVGCKLEVQWFELEVAASFYTLKYPWARSELGV